MKTRILLLSSDGNVVEYTRAAVAHKRILVDEKNVQIEYTARRLLYIDEEDKDPIVLYQESDPNKETSNG